jgi:hypothetical protein
MSVADNPYIFKFNLPVSEIGDEDTAIAVLSGLEPEFFIRARGLKNKTASTASDKKFARDYSAFIAEESSRFFLFEIAYDRIRAKRLWSGDFHGYMMALHNDGVFLERDVHDYLQSEGFELLYADNSPVMQCYRTALARKLWTLDEAVSLFTGTKIDGYEFMDLRKETAAIRKLDPSWQNLDGNREKIRRREWCYEDKDTGRSEILRDWLARHTAADKKIEAKEADGETLYKPKTIVNWLREVTGQEPVPVLDKFLSPQKGCIKKSKTASIAEHRRVFDELQKEYEEKGQRLSRPQEEHEMRERLKPKSFKVQWHRELRKEADIPLGRPPEKTGNSKVA